VNEFYRQLEVPIIRERMERVAQNRPENLHEYQGCANDQARAAEQLPFSRERHRMNGCVEYDGDMGYPDNRCEQCKQHDTAARPPAGDVVERMWLAFMSKGFPLSLPDMKEERMAAALRVAREGMVNLDSIDNFLLRFGQLNNCGELMGRVSREMRTGLAKPAEQTPEQIVERILLHKFTADFGRAGMVAAEIVDALKAGKQ
jgi:hypothetical protein